MTFTVGDAIAVLVRTPDTLRRMLDGLPDSWLDCTEGGESWSPREITAHLLYGEKADWIVRARQILEDGPDVTFAPFDRAGHADLVHAMTIGALIDEFESLRLRNVDTLRAWGVEGDALDRRGNHPAFGPVTLRQLLSTWAVHDLGHIAQIARTMSHRYRDEVGPWSAYLRIVSGTPTG